MRLGETLKLCHGKIADEMLCQQIRQDIMAVLVPRARGRLRVAAYYDFESRIRRIRRKIFVGVNLFLCEMVHG